MKFCSECGSQMIHTETCYLCPCCGETRCSCATCNPVFAVEECVPDDPDFWDLESDFTLKMNLYEKG